MYLSQASFGPASARASKAARPVAAWAATTPWLMLLPLLFFCANGSLIPETTDAAFRVTAGAASDAAHRGPLALVMLICSVLIASRLPLVIAMCQRSRLLLLLPILAIASTAWSQNPRQTVQSAVVLLIITLFAFYTGSAFQPAKQIQILMLAGAVGLAASLLLIVGAPSLGTNSDSWRGIFSNKQNAGSVSTLLIITVLHWRAHGIFQKLFRVGFAMAALLMLIMARSRTGWVLCFCCLCLTAVLALLQRMRVRDAFLSVVLAIPVVGGTGLLVYQNFAVLARAVGKDPTLSQRTIIWGAVWNSITQHFYLGYGYAAFWSGMEGPSLNVVLIAGWMLAQAQDGFLDLWLQLGLVGVLVWGLIICQAFVNLVRSFRVPGQTAFVRWCAVVIAFVLALNIGESSVAIFHMTWFSFLLACIGLSETARLHTSTAAAIRKQTAAISAAAMSGATGKNLLPYYAR
jgi:exopolysaccharide production protein ExoQ